MKEEPTTGEGPEGSEKEAGPWQERDGGTPGNESGRGHQLNVRTTGGVAGGEGEAINAGSVNEAAKQVHEAGGLGRTSVEDSNHAAVVA